MSEITNSSFRHRVASDNHALVVGLTAGMFLLYSVCYFYFSKSCISHYDNPLYRINYYLSFNVVDDYYGKWIGGDDTNDKEKKLFLLSAFFLDMDKNKEFKKELNGYFIVNWVLNLFILAFPTVGGLSFYFRKKKPQFQYLTCPYDDCQKSVLVHLNWTCPLCHNKQKYPHYITEKCHSCKREVDTVYCEYCNREFKL